MCIKGALCRYSVGAVSSERGVSAVRPAEGLSGPASGRAAGGPSQSQRHQRGASPGLLPCLQLPPWRPLPPQPVQHPQQALASHWYINTKLTPREVIIDTH